MGAPPAPSAAAIEVEQVRDNLYVLRGGGRTVQIGGVSVPNAGHTAAFVTATGVVVVDTKLAGWGAAIIDTLEGITNKPVTTVINTHTHFDHVGGNVEFPTAVEIVAHENTAKLMQEMRPVTGGPAQPNIFKESGGRGLPKRTFKDRMALGSGDDRIELHYFGRGHTGGDTWVVFPALRVAHVGDAFAHKAVPPLDASNGGSGVEYPQTIARAVAALTDIDTIIAGHYPTTLTLADLRTYGEFTRELVRAVQAARKSGRPMDDFVNAWTMPERYLEQGYLDIAHLRPLRADVEVIWNEAS